jgi:hypothetical protein
MSTWRRKAIEFLPENKQLIEAAESPTQLWIELHSVFLKAIEGGDEKLQKNILGYANWCASDEAGSSANETHQAVYCGFLEDITMNRKHFPLFKKWFSPAQFEKYKGSFMYSLDEKLMKELEDIFYGK